MPLKIECTAVAPSPPPPPAPLRLPHPLPKKREKEPKMIERGQKRQVASHKPKIMNTTIGKKEEKWSEGSESKGREKGFGY